MILLLPLSALFSALCLALATFARSTKEGQYYLTPLLMVVMGLTMFCLSPAVEMTPLYSVIPVVNVALLLKGLLLNSASSGNLVVYAVPVLISSIGYSMLSGMWWAIELYNSEDVLFREAEKFDIRMWFRQLLRTKDAVPVLPEAGFCFILNFDAAVRRDDIYEAGSYGRRSGADDDAADCDSAVDDDCLSGSFHGRPSHDKLPRHSSPSHAIPDGYGHRVLA